MWKRVLIMACVAVCAACGSTQGGNAPGSSGSTSSPVPNAVNLAPFPADVLKACKGVDTTTPLAKAPQACQELWTPMGVTEVPPMNLFDHLPAIPPVINDTNGAVSESNAHTWALAYFRTQVLWQWAERYSQISFFSKLASPAELPQQEANVLGNGSYIQDPACDTFPTSLRLVPVTSANAVFFETVSGMTTSSKYALLSTLSPVNGHNCVVYAVTDAGLRSPYSSFSTPLVVIEAGSLETNSVLGNIWSSDAITSCSAAYASSLVTPPSGWCS